MLAQSRTDAFDSPDYLYEVKWDGIRAMVTLDEGNITIRSRAQRDITNLFPELLIPDQAFRAACGLFDVEIVCLNEKGQPVFEDVLHRLQHRNEASVNRARAKHPAVAYVFDCLYVDGRPIVNEPLARRRAWMVDSIKLPNPAYRPNEAIDEGVALFEAASRARARGDHGQRAQQRLHARQAHFALVQDQDSSHRRLRDHRLHKRQRRPRIDIRRIAIGNVQGKAAGVRRQSRHRLQRADFEEQCSPSFKK